MNGMRSRIIPLTRAVSSWGEFTARGTTGGSGCIFCSFRRISPLLPRSFTASKGRKREFVVRNPEAARNYSPETTLPSQKPSEDKDVVSNLADGALESGSGFGNHSSSVAQLTVEILASARPPPTSPSIPDAEAEGILDEDFILPPQCPGCGAPSQTTEPEKSGYYSTKKKREWMPRRIYRELNARGIPANVVPGDVPGNVLDIATTAPGATFPPASSTLEAIQTRGLEEGTLGEADEVQEEEDVLFKAKVPDLSNAGSGLYSTIREDVNSQTYEEPYGEGEGEEGEEGDLGVKETKEHELGREGESLEGDGFIASAEAKEDPAEVELRKQFFAEQEMTKPPLCARCHSLTHHSKGSPLSPPTFATVTKPIAESQFPNVYIYHVVDAADFPLSVLPGLRRNVLRHLPDTRSVRRNVTFSLIVTRADLLMPKETMVSSLMTYLRTVLKEALPEWMKAGDIRVVSAKNTWTTERVKRDIRGSRGSVFLIGRTNVGKSRLFESIFPRSNNIAKQGSSGWGKGDGVERGGFNYDEFAARTAGGSGSGGGDMVRGESHISTFGRSKGYQYVEMPTVNEMPGTTAGAIRIPFSNGKGELVDLPGLARGNLLDYVRDECVKDTVMTSRVTPEQFVIKPGQTLVLGGLIRISAVTEKVTLLAYPFLTLPAHVTNPARAQELLSHPDPASSQKPILWSKPLIGDSIQSAGTFALGWDVTQRRDPRLKHYTAEDMEKIPYKIYSTDILVEGCGWVELVAEVLKWKDPPVVEVWSPLGKSIGSRPPMGAQAMGKKKKTARPGSRPKRSMKGRAKESRRLAREAKVPEFWRAIDKMAHGARGKHEA